MLKDCNRKKIFNIGGEVEVGLEFKTVEDWTMGGDELVHWTEEGISDLKYPGNKLTRSHTIRYIGSRRNGNSSLAEHLLHILRKSLLPSIGMVKH